MALSVAMAELNAALVTLASGDEPATVRLQAVWDGPVARLWEGMYLPSDLNDRFKQMWAVYAASSDDPRSTALRQLTSEEVAAASEAVIDLAVAVSAADALGAEPAQKQR